MRGGLRLAASAACGVAALLLASGHADSVRAEVEQERSEMLERYGGEVTTLVVVREGAPAGEVLGEEAVEEREWLSALAPEGALTSVDEAVGKKLTSPVAAGEPLNEVDFLVDGETLEVPEGRVAISVRLSDRSGLSSDVAAGSRVQAYVATSSGVRLLTSDVVVLSATSARSGTAERTATLAVLPRDVTAVLEAGSEATLRLVLPAGDVSADGADAGDGAATGSGMAADEGESGAAPTTVAPATEAEAAAETGGVAAAETGGVATAETGGVATGAAREATDDAPATAGASAEEGGA